MGGFEPEDFTSQTPRPYPLGRRRLLYTLTIPLELEALIVLENFRRFPCAHQNVSLLAVRFTVGNWSSLQAHTDSIRFADAAAPLTVNRKDLLTGPNPFILRTSALSFRGVKVNCHSFFNETRFHCMDQNSQCLMGHYSL